MNTVEKYNQKQKLENSNRIAVDFDGVIHKNSLGFHDGTVYDRPTFGCRDALKTLYTAGYDIVVFTAKAKEDRPLIDGKTGTQLIWEWLRKWDLDFYITEVTSEKPRARFYIDDRAVPFTDWNTTLDYIKVKDQTSYV